MPDRSRRRPRHAARFGSRAPPVAYRERVTASTDRRPPGGRPRARWGPALSRSSGAAPRRPGSGWSGGSSSGPAPDSCSTRRCSRAPVSGHARLWRVAEPVLDLISVPFIAAVLVVAVVVALVRRRWLLAAQVALFMAGANLTAQLLKLGLLDRADLGVGGRLGNTLPSGHTTAAASCAVALVLVVRAAPRRGCGRGGRLHGRDGGLDAGGRLAPARRRGRGGPAGAGVGLPGACSRSGRVGGFQDRDPPQSGRRPACWSPVVWSPGPQRWRSQQTGAALEKVTDSAALHGAGAEVRAAHRVRWGCARDRRRGVPDVRRRAALLRVTEPKVTASGLTAGRSPS